MLSILDLLDSRNFCAYNRTLAVEIGMVEAILLCEFISSYKYYLSQNALTTIKGEEGWFYETAEKIFERTGMKVDMQQAARNRLVAKGFLETKDHGLPCRKYYRLKQDAILDLFKEKSTRIGSSRNRNREFPKQESGVPDTRHYIYEPEMEPKEDLPLSQAKPAPVASADAERLAEELWRSIQKVKANFKPPNLKAWAKDIDAMLRLDNRTLEQIRKILAWLPTDPFWQSNILSAKKLRLQFDQLELKATQKPRPATAQQNRKTQVGHDYDYDADFEGTNFTRIKVE